MRHIGGHGRPRDAHWLQGLLEAVREDDAETPVPPEIYNQVMLAWDGRARLRKWRRIARLSLAAAAIASVGVWWVSPESPSGSAIDSNTERIADSLGARDAVLATDVLIDDASSVQYVRLSVAPQAMAAFGIPVVNSADDAPVAVEALVGLDGVPRAIRYARVAQEAR